MSVDPNYRPRPPPRLAAASSSLSQPGSATSSATSSPLGTPRTAGSQYRPAAPPVLQQRPAGTLPQQRVNNQQQLQSVPAPVPRTSPAHAAHNAPYREEHSNNKQPSSYRQVSPSSQDEASPTYSDTSPHHTDTHNNNNNVGTHHTHISHSSASISASSTNSNNITDSSRRRTRHKPTGTPPDVGEHIPPDDVSHGSTSGLAGPSSTHSHPSSSSSWLSLHSYVSPRTTKRWMRIVKDNKIDVIFKVVASLLISLVLVRHFYHMYEDSDKYDSFTIVSLLHDMTPTTLAADRTQFAFQYTALLSWSRLVVGRNIIIYVDTQASCDFLSAQFRDIQCYPIPCWHPKYHRPYLDCVFLHATYHSETDIMVYVNSDIVLDTDLAETITYIDSQHTRYFCVATRTDTILSASMINDFKSPSFQEKVKQHALTAGVLHKSEPIDLFIYRKSILSHSFRFPRFLAGVLKWDQWWLSQMILDDTINTIDITSSVLAIHLQRGTKTHIDTAAAAHNNDLIRKLNAENAYKIGRIENCPMKTIGQCPNCTIVSNPDITDLIIFTKRVSKDGYLVVLTVNHGYLSLAWNWVCWAERIHFNNYILIAEDRSSGEKFTKRGIPVITRGDAPETKPAADYGTAAFQETMTFRTEFLMSVLSAGYHFVTADMDGIWLDDPIQYFDPNADLQGQMHKDIKISGGLVVVRATTYGKFFWNKVIDCQRANADFLATLSADAKYEPSTKTEQYCINELALSLANERDFKRHLLDPYLFPDGKSFFEEHNSQLRGITPAIIHNNWIVSVSNKLNRIKEWQLQSADEDSEECLPITTIGLPALTENSMIAVKLRVMTYNRPESLRRLLASLLNSEYHGDKVDIEISVDHPVPLPEDEDVMKWKETLAIAKEFQWPHGDKLVIQQDYNIGLVGQWTKGWIPTADDDSTLVFFIEDDVGVSPVYYTWLKLVIDAYYKDPNQFDPRMFGISLQRQNRILGETHEQQYGSRIPADVLGNRILLYRYQLIGTWGTLFFPAHWRAFQEWLSDKQVDINSGQSGIGFKPCVPTLLSNIWYLENPAKTWSQWFIRFAYEKGWYSLYANYPHDHALVVNYREPGLNSKFKKDRIGDLIANLTDDYLNFPPLATIPVYDFHFNRIQTPDVLGWRQYVNNEKFIDQCWTIRQLSGLLRDRRLAQEAEEAAKIKAKEDALKAEKKKAEEESKKKKAAAAPKKNTTTHSNGTLPAGVKLPPQPKKPSNGTKKAAASNSTQKLTVNDPTTDTNSTTPTPTPLAQTPPAAETPKTPPPKQARTEEASPATSLPTPSPAAPPATPPASPAVPAAPPSPTPPAAEEPAAAPAVPSTPAASDKDPPAEALPVKSPKE